MKAPKSFQFIKTILASCDVGMDGDRPWDIRVTNPGFYERVLSGGSLALGESYMDGWWHCKALDQFFDLILSGRLDRQIRPKSPAALWAILKAKATNAQRISKAFEIGKRHYDIGNNLFTAMLDKGMNYSCGYWKNATTLDAAQAAKLELICRKIGLDAGMKVLDIGCGWGGFSRYAAEKYNAVVHGITVSREQSLLAAKRCRGLDVKIELRDYRSLKKTYDRIVSIGMFEHVGYRNYRNFMEVVHGCLDAEGIFLLHTIAGNTTSKATDPWIDRYIFPDSLIPSARQLVSAAEGLFVLEDWHSFGSYYDQTLTAWYDNFRQNWSAIESDYDERFYRMWVYYLLSCAGSFRCRRNQLWQIVFSKKGIRGGFQYRR